MDHKYRYTPPKSTEERIEALYEQTQLSEKSKFLPSHTIRDVLEKILQLMDSQKRKSQQETDDAKFFELVSHIACAVLGLVLLFSAGNMAKNHSWANESVLFFSGLTLLMIFLSVSLEKHFFFRFIWKYGAVKFMASIIFTALLVHASSVSSSTINSVFGVDSSSFVYTRSILTGILMFKMFIPVFWLVLMSCIFHLVVVVAESRKNKIPLMPILNLLGSLIISAFVIFSLSGVFDKGELEFKAYKLAHIYDFNDKIHCVDENILSRDIVGIYLGNSHSQYLLDDKIKLNEELIDFIFRSREKSQIEIPGNFFTGKCL